MLTLRVSLKCYRRATAVNLGAKPLWVSSRDFRQMSVKTAEKNVSSTKYPSDKEPEASEKNLPEHDTQTTHTLTKLNVFKSPPGLQKPTPHAQLILNDKDQEIRWIPPPAQETAEEFYRKAEERMDKLLPPPPRHFTSHPQDQLEEQEFMKKMQDILPPYDIRRVPYYLSQPWFARSLQAYCLLLAIGIALWADFESMNDGHDDHVFTGFRHFVYGKWNSLWTLKEKEEEELLKERLLEVTDK